MAIVNGACETVCFEDYTRESRVTPCVVRKAGQPRYVDQNGRARRGKGQNGAWQVGVGDT